MAYFLKTLGVHSKFAWQGGLCSFATAYWMAPWLLPLAWHCLVKSKGKKYLPTSGHFLSRIKSTDWLFSFSQTFGSFKKVFGTIWQFLQKLWLNSARMSFSYFLQFPSDEAWMLSRCLEFHSNDSSDKYSVQGNHFWPACSTLYFILLGSPARARWTYLVRLGLLKLDQAYFYVLVQKSGP